MKKSEKRKKMIEIFEKKGMMGSLLRDCIDECLALDDPKSEFINEIKGEMKSWFGFDLTDNQVKEYLEHLKEEQGLILQWFDTVERDNYASYISNKIIGMDWPMNGSSQEYKDTFYKSLVEQAPLFGYNWLKE